MAVELEGLAQELEKRNFGAGANAIRDFLQILFELNAIPENLNAPFVSVSKTEGESFCMKDLSFLEIPQGYAIKAWRKHSGLSLTKLAKLSGLSKSYISQLEHGKVANVGRRRLELIAQVLEVSPTTLFFRVMPTADAERDFEKTGN